jgi:hypothetical protein
VRPRAPEKLGSKAARVVAIERLPAGLARRVDARQDDAAERPDRSRSLPALSR